MDDAAKDSVYRESLRKFFVDLLGDDVYFDKNFIDPTVFEKAPTKWFVVDSGGLDGVGGRFEPGLRVICCTRRDPERTTLSEQVDTVRDGLRDATKPDGCRRIPLVVWNSGTETYDTIGGILVEKNPRDSGDMSAPDQSNYRILSYRAVWVANG
jgi:hypothetical protein